MALEIVQGGLAYIGTKRRVCSGGGSRWGVLEFSICLAFIETLLITLVLMLAWCGGVWWVVLLLWERWWFLGEGGLD